MVRIIKWRNKEFLLISTGRYEDSQGIHGAIATREQFSNFTMNDFHLNMNGDITTFGRVVGRIEEIEFLGEEKEPFD